MASLWHPNLVAIYDIVVDGADLLLVMEYIEGRTLADVLTSAPLSWERTEELLRPVASALDYVHAKGIVHRDLQPSNVMVGDDGSVKLADLGLATAAEITKTTPPGAIMGTPAYMAPEQARPEPQTPAAGVFALATIAFEALSGSLPRWGQSVLSILHQATREPPADLREHRANTPAGVAQALISRHVAAAWGDASHQRRRCWTISRTDHRPSRAPSVANLSVAVGPAPAPRSRTRDRRANTRRRWNRPRRRRGHRGRRQLASLAVFPHVLAAGRGHRAPRALPGATPSPTASPTASPPPASPTSTATPSPPDRHSIRRHAPQSRRPVHRNAASDPPTPGRLACRAGRDPLHRKLTSRTSAGKPRRQTHPQRSRECQFRRAGGRDRQRCAVAASSELARRLDQQRRSAGAQLRPPLRHVRLAAQQHAGHCAVGGGRAEPRRSAPWRRAACCGAACRTPCRSAQPVARAAPAEPVAAVSADRL